MLLNSYQYWLGAQKKNFPAAGRQKFRIRDIRIQTERQWLEMSLGGIQQYQANTASNTQTLGNVKETIGARPAAQAQELMPGRVFEGMVTDIKNGQVTLGLSDGRTISARMEAGVQLEKGQPMLFEVKSNTGDQIAIRPVTLESAQNPTLLRALEAAGLKVSPRNLSMVNQMMMEQLPIDKNSLMQMARAAANFPQAEMQTLVQMQKLGLAITENSLNQFQNYQNGQQAILPDMQQLMEGLTNLPEQLFGKEGKGHTVFPENFMLGESQNAAGSQNTEASQLLGLQKQILGILLGEGSLQDGAAIGQGMQNGEGASQVLQNGDSASQLLQGENVSPILQEGVQNGEGANQLLQEGVQNGEGANQLLQGGVQNGEGASQLLQGENVSQLLQEGVQNGESANQLLQGEGGNVSQLLQNGDGISQPLQEGGQVSGKEAAKISPNGTSAGAMQEGGAASQNPIDSILTKDQQGNLAAILKEFPGAGQQGQLFSGGQLNTSLSASELLRQMMGAIEQGKDPDSGAVKKLFSSEEFKGLMKQAMAEQWMLTPEQLKEEGAVKELYQRLSRQMADLQQTLAQAGKEGAALAKTAQSVQGNLEFMNQLNQAYAYVQLPLKLRQQNAHSDLYVYTNKKNLRDKEGDLSALLHLDLEHLGATDIYVKMHGAAVQTDFYLADELSFRLISGLTGQLAERLEQKGYTCEIKVENRKPQKHTVQEFLEQEKPQGKLHRYSFDVKA